MRIFLVVILALAAPALLPSCSPPPSRLTAAPGKEVRFYELRVDGGG